MVQVSTAAHGLSLSSCSFPPAGASEDGAIIAYNADSPKLFGYVYHYPRAVHPPGKMRSIYDWDSGGTFETFIQKGSVHTRSTSLLISRPLISVL